MQSLPGPLDHYAEALAAVFADLGYEVTEDLRLDVQQPGNRLPRLIVAYLKRSVSRTGRLTIVLWPSFGLLEPLLWIRRRKEVLLIIHDAAPLRRQRGYGRISAWAGALAVRLGGVQVVTHSPAASEALMQRGWPETAVVPLPVSPLPISPAEAGSAAPRAGVRVLGQFKPSRDLAALAQLAAGGVEDVLTVVGRGWPEVQGWDVVDEFVSDKAFARLIATSRAIVIPYRRVWQSDVAVRALEALTPVVCHPTPGIALTWGVDWPGYVRDDDWLGALTRALAVPEAELIRRRTAARGSSRQAWQTWLTAREAVTSQSAAPPPTS